MLFFCFVYVTLFLRIFAREYHFNMTNVTFPQMICQDNKTTLFFVELNENLCYITDSWYDLDLLVCMEQPLFLRPSYCKTVFEYCLPINRLGHDRRCDGDCATVIVPEYFRPNLPEVFENEVFRGDNFTVINCNFHPSAVYFEVNKPFYFYYGEQNNGTTNGTIDLYLYIGAGVAVFVAIVIAQTCCIVRYRKRVANTTRTLDVVLCSQEEKMNDKSVRYSTGPELRRMVKNTKTNKNNEEVYASIESLEDDIEPWPVLKAPPIPQSIPNEMPDGYLEPITLKQSQTRPRLPLPHEVEPGDVKVLPQMTSPSALQVRAQQPPITLKPRLPHPQTPFQPRPVLPPNFRPNFTPSAVNVLRHSFSPMSQKHPTTDPQFGPLPPPPMSSTTSSTFYTSDDEWTYEKLPPFKAYLH